MTTSLTILCSNEPQCFCMMQLPPSIGHRQSLLYPLLSHELKVSEDIWSRYLNSQNGSWACDENKQEKWKWSEYQFPPTLPSWQLQQYLHLRKELHYTDITDCHFTIADRFHVGGCLWSITVQTHSNMESIR